VRRRRWSDASAETDLIFNRARQGAMVWTQPIEGQMVSGNPFDLFETFMGGAVRERWVQADPAHRDRLLGALWLEPHGWRNARLSQFIDPALDDPAGRCALLARVLNLPDYEGWSLRVESVAGDEPVEAFLRQMGFRQVRALTQMRLEL
jgi:hypothetical protein